MATNSTHTTSASHPVALIDGALFDHPLMDAPLLLAEILVSCRTCGIEPVFMYPSGAQEPPEVLAGHALVRFHGKFTARKRAYELQDGRDAAPAYETVRSARSVCVVAWWADDSQFRASVGEQIWTALALPLDGCPERTLAQGIAGAALHASEMLF